MKKNAINISKIIILIIIIITCTACPDNTNGNGNKPLEPIVGKFTWTEWQQQAGWDDYSASDYTPDAQMVDSLKQLIASDAITFIIFSSNWCRKDCVPEMPIMMKLLIELGYEQDSIEIYGLSRDKKEPAGPISHYGIEFVPTLVILTSGEVVGKIIERPADNKTWEAGILQILTN